MIGNGQKKGVPVFIALQKRIKAAAFQHGQHLMRAIAGNAQIDDLIFVSQKFRQLPGIGILVIDAEAEGKGTTEQKHDAVRLFALLGRDPTPCGVYRVNNVKERFLARAQHLAVGGSHFLFFQYPADQSVPIIHGWFRNGRLARAQMHALLGDIARFQIGQTEKAFRCGNEKADAAQADTEINFEVLSADRSQRKKEG